jgi:hypothetical protein
MFVSHDQKPRQNLEMAFGYKNCGRSGLHFVLLVTIEMLTSTQSSAHEQPNLACSNAAAIGMTTPQEDPLFERSGC